VSEVLFSFGALNLIASAAVLFVIRSGSNPAGSKPEVKTAPGPSMAPAMKSPSGPGRRPGGSVTPNASLLTEDAETARLERELLESFARFKRPANPADSRKESTTRGAMAAAPARGIAVAHASQNHDGMSHTGGTR